LPKNNFACQPIFRSYSIRPTPSHTNPAEAKPPLRAFELSLTAEAALRLQSEFKSCNTTPEEYNSNESLC
jgi:hypothetical protein